MTLSSSIILAVLLDYWLGEPSKYHPLIAFGTLADSLERIFRRAEHSPERQFFAGMLALCAALLPFTVWLAVLPPHFLLETIVAPLVLYFCIAANSLKRHAEAVLLHLQDEDLPSARRALALIVSRDTGQMNARQVRQATIESVLENGADAVFAPLFWFVLAGPAGALLYRLSNTLDAMWGYKTVRYLYFGRAAARFDDALNWLPARLTAFSYALLGQTRVALSCWKRQAPELESPNAGPVMTAGAGALNVNLGGPAYYHGRLKDKIHFGTDRIAENDDIVNATKLIDKTLCCWLAVIVIGDAIA